MARLIDVIALFAVFALLSACGPSQEQLQATVTAALAVTSVAATATAEADVCGNAKVTAYGDEIERLIERFQRQTSVAASTPRMSIGVPLQELLNLQSETEDMVHPECLDNYHRRVVSMMGLYRVAYQTFAAQGDETLVQAALIMGDQELAKLLDELTLLKAGEVPPLVDLDTVPTLAPLP